MTPRARRAVFAVLALGAAALGVRGAASLARDRPAALALAGASAAGPLDETRFTRRVVAEGLDEPMALDFDPDGRVYWVERTGGVKRYDPRGGEVALLGRVPVRVEGEAGLMGILLDRDFAATRRVYLYFSAAGEGEQREIRLSRFTLGADDRLDPASEVVVLRWPYDLASHFGGG